MQIFYLAGAWFSPSLSSVLPCPCCCSAKCAGLMAACVESEDVACWRYRVQGMPCCSPGTAQAHGPFWNWRWRLLHRGSWHPACLGLAQHSCGVRNSLREGECKGRRVLKIKLVRLRLPRLSFNDYFSRGAVSSQICRGSLGMGALSRWASNGIYSSCP